MKLHGSIGPARATVSAVAKEAGVQRATVYRHFPDEESLFDACTAHYMGANPPPNPEEWASISDPSSRLRHALTELYAYFRRVERMLENTGRDAPLLPSMAKSMALFRGYLDAAATTIVTGRSERGRAKRRVRAAVGHAISFPTWQSLVREQGLDDPEAVAVMAAMVECASRG